MESQFYVSLRGHSTVVAGLRAYIQSIGKKGMQYLIALSSTGMSFVFVLAVQNATWQGTNVFGSCLRHTLEREGTFCPSTGTNDRTLLVIPQGP